MLTIKKSNVLQEIETGGKCKEIADRLGISEAELREASKTFNISLRKKKTKAIEFIDDTVNGEPEDITVKEKESSFITPSKKTLEKLQEQETSK